MKHYIFILSMLSGFMLSFLSFTVYSEEFKITPKIDGRSRVLDITVDVVKNDQKVGEEKTVIWQHEIERLGTDYLRIHFSHFRINGNNFEIHITNNKGQKVQVIKYKDLENETDIWSHVINGTYALIELVASTSVTIYFKIDRYIYQARGLEVLSITGGKNQMQRIADYKDDKIINNVQQAVAKLSFNKDGRPRTCTGFLVSDDTLLTNHHCISTQKVCRSTVALFDYQHTEQGRQKGKQFACGRIIKKDYKLDYALLKLKNVNESIGPSLQWAAQELKDKEQIYIIQHPFGISKRISFEECTVTSVIVTGRKTGSDFSHYCDTGTGSSGAPVFNMKGLVVGVHHYGFESGVFWNTNRAVRGSLIKASINK